MAIYLGHNTARRILESKLALDLEPVPYRSMVNCESGRRAVTSTIQAAYEGTTLAQPLARNFFCRPGEPLDVLTDAPDARRAWVGSKCHLVQHRLPPGSFLLLKMGIFVASPALCLMQLAPTMSLIELVKLAMSFCGIYQLEGDEKRMPYDRRPVATPQDILDYLDVAQGIPGTVKVRDAMRWVIPNSGSPMETRMVLPLYMSRGMGGYGLPKPLMNDPIKLSDAASKIAGQKHCFGDAVWRRPRRRPLDFEFQSFEFHDNAQQYGEDYARQLALQHDRYLVQFVTSAQLNNEAQLNELARLVAIHTGTWLPEQAYKWTDLRKELNSEIQA